MRLISVRKVAGRGQRQIGKGRLRAAVIARRESKGVDFKARFDPESEAECIELVKDLVAMANSGGGVILVGVRDDGSPSGADLGPVLRLDPAHLTDKIFRYTGEHFSGHSISQVERESSLVAVVDIEPTDELLVFVRPGNYVSDAGKQKTAFSVGGVYFRHGAKSEPCTPSDLRRHIQERVARERSRWITGIRQVVESPLGSEVAVIERTRTDPEGRATRVRLTNDPDAPVFGRLNPDDTHPHRLSGVVRALNARSGSRKVTQHDILSARSANDIDEQTRPDFAYKPKYDSMHYSDSFIEWLDVESRKDPEFFKKGRVAADRLRQLAAKSG